MIKIGKIDKKLIFPVFAGILYFPFYFISERSAIKSHYLMNSLCSAMGMSLSIIPYLISKYNMKNFCSLKCKKDYEKKQRSQNMCFECRKMFDIMEGFIAFEGEKFCSNECKNKFINEEKGNFKNKKQNKKKIIKKENNDAPEKNEDEEEEDIYDPMDDF